jgi:hypothetical protein
MKFKFEWNEFADQPHNVAPRSERTRHHIKHWPTYFSLAAADLVYGLPGLWLYRGYRKAMHRKPVVITPDMFAVSISPESGRNEEVLELLRETGVRQTLVRIPSWEKDKLDSYERFAGLIRSRDFGLTAALLQRREDVFRAEAWSAFLEDVFRRFRPFCSFYEIGHAWNRTKWGVWDYTEYLRLARPAAALAGKYGAKLVGPAVIDFEFHLYPPILRAVSFDKISSLLYVDRVGAPENAQFGWTTAMKIALFKAVADSSARRPCDCWITEVNWPLKNAGRYSPASGRPNVTEEEQADYLVRYYVICLASGLIERVYWWQLIAPGYGLIDSRDDPWRRRPAYFALKTMVRQLAGSVFIGKVKDIAGEIYLFRKAAEDFAVCWTNVAPLEHEFSKPVRKVLSRDGRESESSNNRVKIEGSPKYVFFG